MKTNDQYQTTEQIEARILELASLIEVAETDDELTQLDNELSELTEIYEGFENEQI